ncbi:unnamed protein product [Lactuca virosa]|uniref:Reverse transcriptase domain-containing protein n=1 Tax=Lactuca virosa TaxID=75947 RepID=A0AAU9P044_9ASTR|nr:unnamed protein product [Lactuca virosa]
MNCVTTSSFMINIKGNFHGFFFQGKRGLRQGCPLSPYLFTLVMEVFNLMLKRSIRENVGFKYHWRCGTQKITHLCFADDLMLFCPGNIGSIRIIKKVMDEFVGAAGLIPNLSKSHIFFGNVKEPLKRRILDVLPFVEGKLPMKYLGIPLLNDQGSYAEKVQKCREELDKVQIELDNDPYNGDLRSEEGFYLQAFLNASIEEEKILKQRAKVQWLKEGDCKSAYFHKVVKGNINRNKVETIMDNDGKWKESDEAFKQIVKYFNDFLGVDRNVRPIISPKDLFENKLTHVQALNMVKEITCDEIKAALFDIDEDKALGSDGYTSKFFKGAWVIVGDDFCKAVKEFFLKKKILKEINAIAIALVPKV